ncbi:sodium-dependent phosphate transport protein 2B-like [Biomphalaria glabrata]|uniref:Sodium-dependent phosphate transport protein 2B-like n=1 Tax=Biomphalaria glabrata TaxID=6526 RepID=A0A9W2ZYG8_BIOGL|nr:sodium-dependent phosphate transport protein 2B-like [Biomphalaria glabrata]
MDNNGFCDDQGRLVHGNVQTPDHEKDTKSLTEQTLQNGTKLPPQDVEATPKEEDPWKVTSISQDYTPWSALNRKQKVFRFVSSCVKILLVFGCLYMFICSLDFLSSAFRLLGGEAAGRVFQQSDILTNPITGLMIGVLVTVLVQSSSTSTSIVVSMVGSGIMKIRTAIPIVMGANVGTSVTNTIVAIGQITDKAEFRRAFAGATVHDMFNWLTVLVLLPVEIATGYLYYLTEAIVDSLPLVSDQGADKDILKVITEPFTERIIQVNKNAITNIASGKELDFNYDRTIMKVCCDKKTPRQCCEGVKKNSKMYTSEGTFYSTTQKREFCKELRQCQGLKVADVSLCEQTFERTKDFFNCDTIQGSTAEVTCCRNLLNSNSSRQDFCDSVKSCFNSSTASHFNVSACLSGWENHTKAVDGENFSCVRYTRDIAKVTCVQECNFLFKGLYPSLDDKAIGAILLVISLLILCACLVCIVKLLHSLLQGPMAMLVKKFINADFPGPLAYFTGYLAIIIGAGLTIVVQSSSIFTSTLTPLVGIGVIELDRMYPLTLGSNIGTTTTAILSALANTSGLRNALQIAFCHLFFNITGIVLFYPIPFLRFPIPLAKFLGNCTAKYRWFAIVYILAMFFLFPALIFALSIPGWYVLVGVMGPFVIILIAVCVVKVIQAKRPACLPPKFRNWKFLPLPLRSLEPYDKAMQKLFFCKRFQAEVKEEKVVQNNNCNSAAPASESLAVSTYL